MRKNNYNERIANILNNRVIMQNIIDENLQNSCKNVLSVIEDIELTLMFDNNDITMYKSLISSKEMINDLTEKLLKATEKEEAVKIRNRINYYTKKIKKIIYEKNMDEEIKQQFSNSISKLRKNASKQIRFLNRINRLNEINNLANQSDNLKIEDRNKLRKYLKNENDYNRRFIKNNTINIIKSTENNIKYDKYDPYQELLKEEEKIEEDIQTDNNLCLLNTNEEEQGIDDLDANINKFKKHYKIKSIYKYDINKFNKILTLLKNMPIYKWNKRVIKQMDIDFNCFLLNEDLKAFIEYNKRRNSVKFALNYIFSKNEDIINEGKYIYDSNLYREWIDEYYYNDYTMKKAL